MRDKVPAAAHAGQYHVATVSAEQQSLRETRVRVESRNSFASDCWLSCQAYERAMLQYAASGEIDNVGSVLNACVAKWFALGCAGRRARFVGGSRVRMMRPSPGCGVHRRKQHVVRSVSGSSKGKHVGSACSHHRCQEVVCEHGFSVDMVECGSRWYRWKAKC